MDDEFEVCFELILSIVLAKPPHVEGAGVRAYMPARCPRAGAKQKNYKNSGRPYGLRGVGIGTIASNRRHGTSRYSARIGHRPS
jgi:hypothetical protein